MIGSDTTGKPVLHVDYIVEGINVALDGSLFALEESSAAYKSIDITDVMLSAMNPGRTFGIMGGRRRADKPESNTASGRRRCRGAPA